MEKVIYACIQALDMNITDCWDARARREGRWGEVGSQTANQYMSPPSLKPARLPVDSGGGGGGRVGRLGRLGRWEGEGRRMGKGRLEIW